MTSDSHSRLRQLREKLRDIYAASAHVRPLSLKPPILDSSVEPVSESAEDSSWTQQEQIPGLRQLRESIRLDLDVIEKFLDNPKSVYLPPLSTNAPYLIAVWNELICAKNPVVGVFKTFSVNPGCQDPGAGKHGGRKIPGVKVDIVAENGRRWIRVNTIKNSRIVAEFREIDSYLTDDDSGEEYEGMPSTLAQIEFDNSVLRMGRALLQAAKENHIEGTSEIPRVTLRLTRLNPTVSLETSGSVDPRIAQTIEVLQNMGIDVELGERSDAELSRNSPSGPFQAIPSVAPSPTKRITLDLSALIALISDLTHFPLPATIDEAYTRFVPPQEYREWKEARLENGKPQDKISKVIPERTVEDLPKIYIKQARALTRQLLQEMAGGMIQEIHDRLSGVTHGDLSLVEFWVTPEARSRCLLIVNKIGGANEKRRVEALFHHGSDLESGIRSYWKGSRYPPQYIPLLPIKVFPTSSDPAPTSVLGQEAFSKLHFSDFAKALKKTCQYVLAQEIIPDPRITTSANGDGRECAGEIQRAPVTQVNPRLTAHTVQSMLWGAELGWTVLTGNRSSVKGILREIKSARIAGRLDEEDMDVCASPNHRGGDEEIAALWVVDPRSLAEGMSSLSPTE